MKNVFISLFALSAAFIASCSSVPDSLPSGVTNSYAIGVFNRAKAGDADAKYELSKMYREGSYGFPKNTSRADDLVQDASDDYNPNGDACYEMSLRYRRMGMSSQADRYFQYALDNNSALARGVRQGQQAAEYARQEAEAASQREFDAKWVKCYACNGDAGKRVETNEPEYRSTRVYDQWSGKYLYNSSEYVGMKTEWVRCKVCKDSAHPGYLPR